jgi:hypothetical protein
VTLLFGLAISEVPDARLKATKSGSDSALVGMKYATVCPWRVTATGVAAAMNSASPDLNSRIPTLGVRISVT